MTTPALRRPTGNPAGRLGVIAPFTSERCEYPRKRSHASGLGDRARVRDAGQVGPPTGSPVPLASEMLRPLTSFGPACERYRTPGSSAIRKFGDREDFWALSRQKVFTIMTSTCRDMIRVTRGAGGGPLRAPRRQSGRWSALPPPGVKAERGRCGRREDKADAGARCRRGA